VNEEISLAMKRRIRRWYCDGLHLWK